MKLLSYITLFVIVSLILLRLLYIDFFGNLPIEIPCNKDSVYSLMFVILCICAVYSCVDVIILSKKFEKLRDKHDTLVGATSDALKNTLKQITEDFTVLYTAKDVMNDRIKKLEDQLEK